MATNNRVKVLNRHLTKKGAWSVDGNDRVTRAFRDHSPSGPARDIFDEAMADGNRNEGFSAPVSGNKRPKHKQGSWKRV
jgi:hypothetical protein